MALLVIDLFAYRGVPAARSIASGRLAVDWLGAFGVTGWGRPFAQATSYLLNVWHATMLGVLLSGLALTVLPVYLTPYVTRGGFTGSVFGAMFALAAALLLVLLVGDGAVVRAPRRLDHLPAVVHHRRADAERHDDAARGLAAAGAVRDHADRVRTRGHRPGDLPRRPYRRPLGGADRADRRADARPVAGCSGSGGLYLRLFDLDRIVGQRRLDTPSQLVGAWLRASGRIALVLVPTLWAWSVVASAMFQTLPSDFGNNLTSVVLSAVVGTFFMISTWSEIPMALQLIQSGYSGPAAALLVVLPAISLPCMMLLGGALQRFRVVALLSVGVMIVGIAAGALFL